MAPNRQLTVARERISEASMNAEDMLKGMGIPREVFERVATNALISNPLLAKCDAMSVYQACLLAAQNGLLPDGRSCALVPLKIKGKLKAHMWPMIGGLLTKVRENLPNISIHADAVFEADEWEDIRGTSPNLAHKPARDGKTVDNLIAVYATAFHENNPVPEFEVLYREEIEVFRKMSRSERGPWLTHYIEMAEVRVLKRLLKRLPVNPTLHALIANEAEDGEEEYEYEDDDGDDVIEGTATAAPAAETAPKASSGGGKRQTQAKQQEQEAQPAAEETADEREDVGGGEEGEEEEGMDPAVRF